MRAALVLIGTLFVGVGVVGIHVPGLPTTPFLLLAAACYARSSERLYTRLTSHPRVGPHIQTLVRERAVSRGVKIGSLLLAWTVITFVVVFFAQATWLRLLLLVVLLIKTVVMLSLKTVRQPSWRNDE